MKIYIKNMVCQRCIMVVQSELEKKGFVPLDVSLGKVVFEKELSISDQEIIAKTLQNVGFEIIEDQKKQGVEKVKSLIIDLVQNQNSELKNTLSDYLSTQFKSVTGLTPSYFKNLRSERRIPIDQVKA